MKHFACCLLLTATATATAAAAATPPQDPPARATDAPVSVAEQQFRDAWWAESARNDLEGALRGYLQAAIADGPAGVHARALLFAGRLQQRLGNADGATTAFRKLVTEHPAETELVEQARAQLRALTAQDLRKGYDEWFERRLFTEEVQLAILARIQELAGLLGNPENTREEREAKVRQLAATEGAILSYGKGAVPALRKYAAGGSEQLAQRSIELLFRLGEVPPMDALAANDAWTSEADNWTVLLRQARGQTVPAAANGWHVPFLRAALQGPEPLAQALLTGGARFVQNTGGGIVEALLRDDGARRQLLQAAMSQDTPIALRLAIEETTFGDVALSPAEWLALGRDPLHFELRLRAIDNAAQHLEPQDAALLDEILARAAAASGETQEQLVDVLASALGNHPAVEMLPWTPERLRTVLQLVIPRSSDLTSMLVQLRRRDATRELLARALFEDPAALRGGGDGDATARLDQRLPELFAYDGDLGTQLFATRWNEAVRDALAAAWSGYDEERRLIAVRIAAGVVHRGGERAALAAWAREQAAAASEPVAAALREFAAAIEG